MLQFEGSFLIANCSYNYMFAAESDMDEDDHIVETSPSSCATPNSDSKFLWEVLDAGDGNYYIKNARYGYMYATDTNKKGDDHVIECRPSTSSSDLLEDKFKWKITKQGNYYEIENVKRGASFAAKDDMMDRDHIVESRPSASSDDKSQGKFKWIFFNNYTLCNWMEQLDGNNSLASFSIPGTHDSGARFNGASAGFAQTQERTLGDQMNAGVRFLDIRCRHSEQHFSIFHGDFYQNMNFQEVLDQCYQFLQTNPSEVLIMSVKNEGGGDNPVGTFQEQFESYIASTKSKWFLQNRIPKLDEVRGKIVLLRRFSADSANTTLGIDGTGWSDNNSFRTNNPSAPLNVQDFYSPVSFADHKWGAVTSMLDRSKSDQFDELFINFTSAVVPLVIPETPKTPKSMADQVNPKLIDYMINKKGRFGIIPMDFNSANISAIIINSNF